MSENNSMLFRRDRGWLLGLVSATILSLVAATYYQTVTPEANAWAVGDTGYVNNGAPTATVGAGETDVLVLDITLPNPDTDTSILNGTASSAAKDAIDLFDSTEPGLELFIDNGEGGFNDGDFDTDEDIVRQVHNGSGTVSDGDAARLFSTTDGTAEIYVDHGTANDIYDDGEDILVQEHNGADVFASPATLQAFSVNERSFYDDPDIGDTNTYDTGEAIILDADADTRPSSGDSVVTPGEAGVEALTASDNVCFDGSVADDAEYDAGEVIWWDAAGDCVAFTTTTDVILVGTTAPTLTLTEFGTEQEVAFLDDNNDGSYTCSRVGTCEPVVYSGADATNLADDDDLPLTTVFFDSSTEATDGIATTGTGWDEVGGAEDLYDFFAANETFAYVSSGAYADGDDIFVLYTNGGSAALADGQEGRTFPATDFFEDDDTSTSYTDGDDIFRQIRNGTGAAITTGHSIRFFDADYGYVDADASNNYTDEEDIYQDGDGSTYVSADQVTGINLGNNGTVTDADLAALTVYTEEGSTAGFQFDEDTIELTDVDGTFFDEFEAMTGTVYAAGDPAQRIYVAVDIDALPSVGTRTIIAELTDGASGGDGNCDTDGETACALWLASTSSDGPTDASVTNANTQTLDATPADMQTVETIDGWNTATNAVDSDNVDGSLDALVVTFDEAVDDSTFTAGCDTGESPAGFSLTAGSITGCDTGATADDDEIILLIDNSTWATDGLPEVSYNDDSGDVEDSLGNLLTDHTAGVTNDTAPPAMLSAETDDVDADGEIDRLVITFSESARITDGLAGDGFPALTLSCTGCGGDDEATIVAANYAATSTSTLTLVLDEADVPTNNTSVLVHPTYVYGADGGVAAHAICDASETAGACNDDYPTANEMIEAESVVGTDGAAPAYVDANYFDVSGEGAVYDGMVNHVDVIFSESVSASTYEDGDWTIPTAGALTMSDDTAGSVGFDHLEGTATNTISLSVTADANETGVNGGTEPTVQYTSGAGTPNSIVDASGNAAVSFGPVAIDDNARPVMIQGEDTHYFETGAFGGSIDGTIDAVRIKFTEEVDNSLCEDAEFDFTPNNYGTFTEDIDGFLCQINEEDVDHSIVLAVLVTADQTGVDGGSEPTIAYNDGGEGAIRDEAVDPDTSSANEAAEVEVDLYDAAGPHLLSAETEDENADGLIDTIYAEFSEEIDDATVSVGALFAEDTTFGDYTTDAIDESADDGSVTITISADIPSVTGDTGSEPTLTDMELFEDANGNVSTGVVVNSVDGAAPVICTHEDCDSDLASFFDTNSDGNVEQVVLIWSEDVFGDGGEGSFDGGEFDVYTSDTLLDPSPETSNDSGDASPTDTITIDFAVESSFPNGAGDTGDDWDVDIIGTVDDGSLPGADGNVTPLSSIDLSDVAAPAMGYAHTADTDYDGKLDVIYIDWSELNINFDIDPGLLISVDGYTVDDSISLCEACWGTVGDHGRGLAILEGTDPDTGATPSVSIIGTIADSVGNEVDDESPTADGAGTLDESNPVVVDTSPDDGGSLRPRGEDIVIEFSEEMFTDTIDDLGSDFYLSVNPGGVSVSFDLDEDGNTVMTIEHDPFDNGEVVELSIETGDTALDLEGNILCEDIGDCDHGSDFSITFTARNSGGGGGGGSSSTGGSTTPAIDLTDPTGGESFIAGSTQAITWTTHELGISLVRIEYSANGGASYVILADNLNDDLGTYSWSVPVVSTTTAKIKISGKDGGGAVLATDVSDAFTIALSQEELDELETEVDATAGITRDSEGRRVAPLSSVTGPSPYNGQTEYISQTSPGWYIRAYNYDTVYRVEADGTRRPFWDATTFMTWADDWDDVVWVTDATLATMTLNQPMLPQPGVVLVKISADPNVYWVEESETASGEPYLLRKITSETLASSLFGANWADYVIDIEPTLFTHYESGVDLTTAETLDVSNLLLRALIALLVAGTTTTS